MREATDFQFSAKSLGGYLVKHGLVLDASQLSVRELGGGVSNIVLLVEGAQGRWVAKQSLGKLRVEDDWRSQRERIFREADAIACLFAVLGASVPLVVHVDRGNFLYIMTAAPEGSVAWKELLLKGEVSREIAAGAGRLLAEIIRQSQRETDYRERFSDQTVFDELRIDPYYRTVAARNPDVAERLGKLIEDSSKIRTSLVHGDYSPKNMLVQGKHILLIDFEVVHWGDPAFDAGFLLNHLLLKALHRPQDADLYFRAARTFWEQLILSLDAAAKDGFEAMTVRHLGGLMLARIDGKSPVEYIRDKSTKDRARTIAKHLLVESPPSLEVALACAQKGIHPK